MRKTPFVSSAALALVLALVGIGCYSSATRIEQEWRSPVAQTGELSSVVTLCMCQDETIARNAEDKMAQELSRQGVRATPAYLVLSRADVTNKDRTIAALQHAGFDGIVTMRLVGREQRLTFYPTYDVAWVDTWGDIVTEPVIRLEVNAFSLLDHRLVWSALSEPVNPNDISDVVHDVSVQTSRELARQHLIVGVRDNPGPSPFVGPRWP